MYEAVYASKYVLRDPSFAMLEANGRNSEKVTDNTPIPPPDWEALISQVADEIMAEHSPARILQVRAKLYDLLSHCIPPTTILKVGSSQKVFPSR